MSTVAVRSELSTLRRVLVIVAIGCVLGAALAANATIKRHRVANALGAQSTVAFVHPSGRAQSTAWYCPGPLPLGLKHATSHLVIANAAAHVVHGQLVVATTSGASFSSSVTVSAESTADVALPFTKASTFAAASLLTDGSGIGVEEVTDSTTGRVAAPCVVNPSLDDYIPAGSTKGENGMSLSLYDPGATPSVASVRFATGSGSSSPLALQGLPINAGQVVVIDVARAVAQSNLVATVVTASGGALVVGAIERAPVGRVIAPSLVSGDASGASAWYLPALPAGGTSLNYVYVLDVGTSPTTAGISFSDASGSTELAQVQVAQGGVARVTQGPEASVGALRFARVESKSPVVVEETSLIANSFAVPAPVVREVKPSVNASRTAASALSASIEGLPPRLPSGFAITSATVSAATWMLPGGESDTTSGEFVTFANPTTVPAVITLSTISHGSISVIPKASAILVEAGSTGVVDLSRVLPNEPGVTVVVNATTHIVVAAGLYAKGSKGSVGFSEPVAIPVD